MVANPYKLFLLEFPELPLQRPQKSFSACCKRERHRVKIRAEKQETAHAPNYRCNRFPPRLWCLSIHKTLSSFTLKPFRLNRMRHRKTFRKFLKSLFPKAKANSPQIRSSIQIPGATPPKRRPQLPTPSGILCRVNRLKLIRWFYARRVFILLFSFP